MINIYTYIYIYICILRKNFFQFFKNFFDTHIHPKFFINFLHILCGQFWGSTSLSFV